MLPFSSNSIRSILTGIVFLAILPALAIILYSGLEMRRQAIEDARRETLVLAEIMGEVQNGIARSTRQLLATLARMDEIRKMDGPSASRIIQAIVEENPAYINIAAVDPHGSVFGSGVAYSPTSLADRAHFQGALEQKAFSPGEYIVTRVGQTIPSMAFAYPVLDDRGDVMSVLTAALNLDSFAHFFNVARLPEDAFLAVTDRNGIRLFYYPPKDKTNPIGHPISGLAWERSRGASAPGYSVHEGSDGVRRIFAFQPVRIREKQDPYIYMWAGIPEDRVLQPANQILFRNMLMLTLAAGLAIFIAQLVAGRNLLGPIRQLVNTTRAFASGRTDTRSGLGDIPNELGILARAFDDMADTLAINQERLQQAQKMEAIGVLAGGIAHDFNNILFPILGHSEMLTEDLSKGSPEHESAREIHLAARRATALVSRILSFSRQADHEIKTVYLQRVIMEVERLIRATIPAHIDIRLDIQDTCGPVLADPTHMHQVIMNLLTNAYHAVEKNRGSITVHLKQKTLSAEDLRETTLLPGVYVVLTVSDTGCGISREMVPKLFDPYFTTKSIGKGSGLGLSSVYGIVRAHNGDIRVTTEAGQGAVFEIFLPLSTDGNAVEEESHPEIPLTGSERILLVDDEETIVRVQVQTLERLGYRVDPFTNSIEALKAFSADPAAYDLVMTDMAMPEMTGEELARHAIALRSDIPVILFTGFSETMTPEKAAAAGIKGFLYKPVIRDDMAAMIRQILDAREMPE